MSDIEAVTPKDDAECELEAPDWTREDEHRHNELKSMNMDDMSAAELDELVRLNERNEAFIEAGLEALRHGKLEDDEAMHQPRIKKDVSNKKVWRIVFGIGCCFVGLLIVLLIVAAMSSTKSVNYQRVETMSGTINGVIGDNGVIRFLGVPFATPPVGAYRWKAPHDPLPWQYPLNATSYKSPCIDATGQGSEDCLYLNVYVPVMDKKDDPVALPVMYFIHGGCYTWGEGGPTSADLDGDRFVRQSDQKVILVTAEYRLAAFGFLGSEVLRDKTPGVEYSDSTGNYGVLDQRMVLKWIQKNIKGFGGDPTKVTVFGQSAGGGSVSIQMVTQMPGDNFFSRAIIQSGSFASWTSQSMDAAERSYKYLARTVGCEGNTTEVVECLRKTSATKIGDASGMKNSEVPCRDGCSWAPIVDGVLLKDYPWRLLKKGNYDTSVSLLNFFTRDDGIGFVDDTVELPLEPTADEFAVYINTTYEAPGTDPYVDMAPLYMNQSLYPRAVGDATRNWMYYAAGAIETDAAFACPARRTSRIVSKSTPDVYNMVLGNVEASLVFVKHSTELGFLFALGKVLKSEQAIHVSTVLRGYWTNFAATGNPNGGDLPAWRPFKTGGTELTMYLDRFTTRHIPDYRSEQCDYWDARWTHWGTCLPQPGSEPSTCTTLSGEPCSPSFGIDAETFSRCVHDTNSSWCATSIDAAGNPLSVGICQSSCPTTNDVVPSPRVHPTNQRP